MKVFIGTNEHCGIIHSLSNGFKALNHNVISLIKNEHKFSYSDEYSIKEVLKPSTNKNKIIRKFLSEINKYEHVARLKKRFEDLKGNDLFIFIWDSLLPELEDIKRLRKMNKKIIFLFIGSDVRHVSAFEQEYQYNKIVWTPYLLNEDLNKKIGFIRNAELFADHIYSVPDQAGLQILPYDHFYLPLDVSNLPFNYPDNDIPILVHVPSNRGLKGTALILDGLEKLKDEGLKFELKLLENVKNTEVKKALNNADIAIDQIHLNGPGMFGLEAMASGCALATRYLRQYNNIFSPPVCYIDDTDLLIDNLRLLILDKEYRKKLANEGRQFVERNNNPNKIAQSLIDKFDGIGKSKDYFPNFFLKEYQLKGFHLNEKTKNLNRLVIDKLNDKSIIFTSLKGRGLV
jgi:hypothetical protein